MPIRQRLERSVAVERREPFERPQRRSRTTSTNTVFYLVLVEFPARWASTTAAFSLSIEK